MIKRIVSAIVGVPIFVALVFAGGVYFTITVLILSLLASIEVSRMLRRMGIRPVYSFLYAGALLFPLLLSFEPSWLPSFLALFVFSGTLVSLSQHPESGFLDLGANFFSLLYVSFGFAHFILLEQMEQGMLLLGFAFAVIWLTDSGSFFVGTYLGKHPFFADISPKKTLEGAVGGLITGVGGGVLYCIMVNRAIPLHGMGFLIFLTPFLSVAAQAGDLFESALKRRAKTKDSSQLIPGHGGILDRFDSALWVVPLLYHIMQIRLQIFL